MTRLLKLWAILAVLMHAFQIFAADDKSNLAVFRGEPSVTPGFDRGYFVWLDDDRWYVCWTTQGKMRRFKGTVLADSGKIKSLKRIDVEKVSKVVRRGRAPRVAVGPRGRAHVTGGRAPVVATKKQDKIEKDGDRKIWFNSRTDGDLDGFSFKVDENVETLKLRLEVDGKAKPAMVRLGKQGKTPRKNPFQIKLR